MVLNDKGHSTALIVEWPLFVYIYNGYRWSDDLLFNIE